MKFKIKEEKTRAKEEQKRKQEEERVERARKRAELTETRKKGSQEILRVKNQYKNDLAKAQQDYMVALQQLKSLFNEQKSKLKADYEATMAGLGEQIKSVPVSSIP